MDAEGRIKVMLVTSRETRRWVLPKGWVKKRSKSHQQAAAEAFEEAGLLGKIRVPAVGSYRYPKYVRGRVIKAQVEVFLFDVEDQCAVWPEKGEREAVWVPPAEAAAMVAEPDLATILVAVEGMFTFALRASGDSLGHR